VDEEELVEEDEEELVEVEVGVDAAVDETGELCLGAPACFHCCVAAER